MSTPPYWSPARVVVDLANEHALQAVSQSMNSANSSAWEPISSLV
jgi:hypothetical protein